MRQRRLSEENGFADEDRRPDKLCGYFIGIVTDIGSELASSAQLKHVETTDSGVFCEKMAEFWSFSRFGAKPTVAGRVSSAVVVVEHSTGFKIAIEGVVEEITVIFGRISLAE